LTADDFQTTYCLQTLANMTD